MKISAKIKACILSSTIFPIILLSIYWVHVHFLKVDVVLYSALTDVVIATTVLLGIICLFKSFNMLTWLEKLQMVAIAFLIGSLLALLFPTVIDRSLSFYLLEKLQQRGGGIKLDRIEEVITKEYLTEHQLVSIRLTEQLESGTILIQDGCVTLTERGRNLAQFSRAFRRNLLPRQRLIMNEYSDALTDPFRGSVPSTDYGCN